MIQNTMENYWYIIWHYVKISWYLFGLTIIVAIVFCGLWWLWWHFPKKQVYRLGLMLDNAKVRADVEDNFRKTISQLLGGIAVLIGTGFAYLQFSQQQRSAHELLISNQVSKGFEQFGSNEAVMRLGGIYALEGVMNTSDQYYLPVLEALCAFVRSGIGNKPLSMDIQAALTVIGRRAVGAGYVDLELVKIPGADLAGANLGNANLRSANLAGANLILANLRFADLSSADLTGANLVNANLRNANLTGADLRAANLRFANLAGANLAGANLRNANLRFVDLSFANLSLANVNGADLRKACGVGAILPYGLTLEPCR